MTDAVCSSELVFGDDSPRRCDSREFAVSFREHLLTQRDEIDANDKKFRDAKQHKFHSGSAGMSFRHRKIKAQESFSTNTCWASFVALIRLTDLSYLPCATLVRFARCRAKNIKMSWLGYHTQR